MATDSDVSDIMRCNVVGAFCVKAFRMLLVLIEREQFSSWSLLFLTSKKQAYIICTASVGREAKNCPGEFLLLVGTYQCLL